MFGQFHVFPFWHFRRYEICGRADFERRAVVRYVQACGILAPIFLGQAVDIIKDGERLPWELLTTWAALVSVADPFFLQLMLMACTHFTFAYTDVRHLSWP